MTKTVIEAVEFGTESLSDRQLPQPKLDAELLLCHLLGCERIGIYLNYDRPLTDDEFDRYSELLKQRSRGRPLQYITRRVDFYGQRFSVDEGVFIPRRETEVLVDQALKRLNGEGELSIVDVGTGSGNVAISLALGLPSAKVVGTDVSPKALEIAKKNADRLGVADRTEFVEADLFPLASSLTHSVDLIVSNPPYIADAEIESLPVEVKAEPIETYFGGGDGLEIIRRVVDEGKEYLSHGGLVAIEFGYDQGARVEMLLKESGFEKIEVVRDLSGNDRVATGRTPQA